MFRILLFLFLSLFFLNNNFSQILTFSDPIEVTSGIYASNRQRVSIIKGGVPFILSPTQEGIYAFLIDQLPSSPTLISQKGVNVGLAAGPEVSYNNEILAVSYRTSNGDIQLIVSEDFGETFSAPIIVENSNAYLPNVTVSVSGNIYVSYLVSQNNWTEINQYVKSTDNLGVNFTKPISVDEFTPDQACECCFATIVADVKIASVFRNNENNIRNIYTSISNSQDLSFNNYVSVDELDWVLNACPDAGPDAFIDNDDLYIAWLTGASGVNRVNVAHVNITSLDVLNTQEVSNVSNTILQSHPSIAGSGDTLAVVWRDNRYTFNNVFLSYSLDGGESFSNSILINDSIPFTKFDSPHIAYHNNVFHIVYWGETQNKVFYQTASIDGDLYLSEDKNDIALFPNPVQETLQLNNHSSFSIYNLKNQLIHKGEGQKLNISFLPAGTYFLRTPSSVHKFVKE